MKHTFLRRVSFTITFFYLLLICVSIGYFNLPGYGFKEASAGQYPPVANAGNWTFVEPGEEVFFSALGSYDPDDDLNGNGVIDGNETNTLVKYEWDFDGDGIFDWNSTENGNTVHVYEKEGNYTAVLRVTDRDGMRDTDVFYVFVYKDESETKYRFTPEIYLLVGAGEIAVAVVLLYSAYLIRKRYYTAGEEYLNVFGEKDEEKMTEEREIADKIMKNLDKKEKKRW